MRIFCSLITKYSHAITQNQYKNDNKINLNMYNDTRYALYVWKLFEEKKEKYFP